MPTAHRVQARTARNDERVHCGVFFCRPRAPLPAHPYYANHVETSDNLFLPPPTLSCREREKTSSSSRFPHLPTSAVVVGKKPCKCLQEAWGKGVGRGEGLPESEREEGAGECCVKIGGRGQRRKDTTGVATVLYYCRHWWYCVGSVLSSTVQRCGEEEGEPCIAEMLPWPLQRETKDGGEELVVIARQGLSFEEEGSQQIGERGTLLRIWLGDGPPRQTLQGTL